MFFVAYREEKRVSATALKLVAFPEETESLAPCESPSESPRH